MKNRADLFMIKVGGPKMEASPALLKHHVAAINQHKAAALHTLFTLKGFREIDRCQTEPFATNLSKDANSKTDTCTRGISMSAA